MDIKIHQHVSAQDTLRKASLQRHAGVCFYVLAHI